LHSYIFFGLQENKKPTVAFGDCGFLEIPV
jgi:hypothetical protein